MSMAPQTSTGSGPPIGGTNSTQGSPWWANLWEIPPIGMAGPNDHALFANVRTRLAVESKNERDKFVRIRNACINIFNYGDYTSTVTGAAPPDDDKFIINQAQGDLIGIKDTMFREPVQIEIAAEDDGSEVLAYYWNGPDQTQQPMTGVDPETGQTISQTGPTGQPMMQTVPSSMMYGAPPSVPDPVTGEMIAQPLDEQHAQQLLASGIPESWIISVDNKTVSDVEQLEFDSFWRKAFMDEWLDQFTLTTLKGGWNTGLYQHDPEEGHKLFNIPVTNCFPDPTKQFVWQWEYCVVHWVLRLNVAQRLFPQYSQLLADRSQIGQPKRVDALTEMGYQYDRDWQSRTVTLSITYMADQPIPMTPEEAINGGHVTSQPQPQPPSGGGLPSEGVSQVVSGPGAGGDPADGTPNPTGDSSPEVTPNSAATQPYPSPPPSGPSPMGIASAQSQQPAAPVYMMHGTPVEQSGPQWPMRYTLRQFVMLDEMLIEDDECPWPYIPITHATCIPIEDSPYGFSPLWKMRFSQRSDSQMAEAISRNCKFIGNPASWAHEGVKQRMKKELQTAFIEPDMMIGLVADEFDPSGKPKIGFIEVPMMNENHVEGRQQMQNDRKELGGYTDALKGVPVTSDAPAELQRETQQAASGVVASISKHLQGSFKHLATLQLHAILHYTPFDEIYRRCKKYRRDVLAAIHLVHAPQITWKIDAMLSSGSGSQQNQRRQDLLALNQTPNQLCDDETTQEAWNLDPATIKARKLRNAQDNMAVAAASGQVQPPKNGNGNGHPTNNRM